MMAEAAAVVVAGRPPNMPMYGQDCLVNYI